MTMPAISAPFIVLEPAGAEIHGSDHIPAATVVRVARQVALDPGDRAVQIAHHIGSRRLEPHPEGHLWRP